MTRDSPQLALLRPLRWRDAADGRVELHDPSRDTWARLVPWTRGVLEGLAAGDDISGLAKRAGEGVSGASLRRFLQTLTKVGYLEIVVPVPALARPGYAVARELGRGGVGIAYEATDASGGRVVVKRAWGFIHPLEVANAAMRREGEILAKLDHAAIVRFRDAFVEDGREHLVRSLVDGPSLLDAFGRAPAAPAQAARVADGLCDAVGHLHERRLLLLDHKPSNIHLDAASGAARLVDVGNAEASGPEGVHLLGVRGTRSFIPPEIVSRRFADERSDVWGIGRMIAFMLTSRIFRGEEPSLAAVAEGLDGEPRALVETLCAEDPAGRPASVAEARDGIRAALR